MYLFIAAFKNNSAHLYLTDLKQDVVLKHLSWACSQNLSQTLLSQLNDFLKENNLEFQSIQGLGVFAGPAGFTDLRITHTVANALAYSLEIPVVNAKGDNWQKDCHQLLQQKQNYKIIKPHYGRPANITLRKK